LLYSIKPISNIKTHFQISNRRRAPEEKNLVQIRETNIKYLNIEEEHQRYIDFGSSQSNRQLSRVRLAKKGRNENDSILSQEMTVSLSSFKSPERQRRKNDSPFLRISDLGNSVMGGDSNLFSQIKQF
jgi:hypothetical protein